MNLENRDKLFAQIDARTTPRQDWARSVDCYMGALAPLMEQEFQHDLDSLSYEDLADYLGITLTQARDLYIMYNGHAPGDQHDIHGVSRPTFHQMTVSDQNRVMREAILSIVDEKSLVLWPLPPAVHAE